MPVRILVVDDDDSIRELVSEILRDEGYDIVQARNGAAALQSVDADGAFQAVVLDMRMPLLDGWQFASELEQRGAAIPIIVMTAAQNARRWAEEIGAAGYIAKPFGIDELLETVRSVSERSSEQLSNDSLCAYLARVRLTVGQLVNSHWSAGAAARWDAV
jgi:DNA-binding NtrC family response regulator